ncbi:MAG: hypothetical protein MUO59_02195 [Actinobacteria bacterium]|nr:hypothetical protein [Actinomycetota bacterium]
MIKKSTSVFLALLNLIGFLATVAVNAMAVLLPINNKSTEELSDQYPNLFVPSGLTFSIWGIIYILLGIYIIYNLVVSFKKNTDQQGFIEKIGILFFLSSILNIGWILAWHYEMVLISLVIMVALFAVLLVIYLRLGIGKSETRLAEKGLVHIAFSIYIGWITIATIANVTALLVDIGWNGLGFSEQFWAVLVIVVGIIIAVSVLFSRNDIFYCLVVDWAFLGILIKRMGDKTVDARPIIITIIVGLAVITLGILVQIIRRRKLY